ncbi:MULTISPECIES: bacteriocin-like protein [unclassified Chryseobacterium]
MKNLKKLNRAEQKAIKGSGLQRCTENYQCPGGSCCQRVCVVYSCPEV